MDSDRLNRWLTLGANLGVLAGLIILILEVNQANSLAEAETIRGRFTDLQDTAQQYALSADLAEIYMRARQDGVEALRADEIARLAEWERARILSARKQQLLYQMGYVDQDRIDRMFRGGSRSLDFWEDLDLVAGMHPDLYREFEKAKQELK